MRLIRDYASRDGTAGVEFIELRSAVCVERQQIPIEVAAKNDAARGRGYTGDDRRIGMVFPQRIAGVTIHRIDPSAPRPLAGDRCLARAKVELSLFVFRRAGDNHLAEIDR